MPKPNASPKMDRFVVPYDPSEDAAVCAAICETLYVERFVEKRSGRAPASTAAIAGEMRASLWRSVLAAFVEGFGAYGMAFGATAYVPYQAAPPSRESALQGYRIRRLPSADEAVLQATGGSGDGGRLPWHRRALAFMSDAIRGCAAHWRRERDIRRAVAALAQLDDRMLRDMGIPSRTEIEHVVRFCHDC